MKVYLSPPVEIASYSLSSSQVMFLATTSPHYSSTT
jgi:hypothetical protein